MERIIKKTIYKAVAENGDIIEAFRSRENCRKFITYYKKNFLEKLNLKEEIIDERY